MAGSTLPLWGGATRAQAPPNKHALWNNANGPHLRGAVLTQRRVYPEIDGPEFLGPGPAGVPIGDNALAALAAAGANLLILSHPGIMSEEAPFRIDVEMLAHLDDLVTRAERFGLYVVIGYRSGPGRSGFTFHRDGAGSWFPASMLNDRVWTEFRYHDAWLEMWRETARHFRNRANVAGYLLMVEPNANQVAVGPDGEALEVWEPQALRDHVAGTPADWSTLAHRLTEVVRQTDPDMPVLISPDGYASSRFEPNLELSSDDPAVLCVHDYAPRDYTHQASDHPVRYAPGDGRFAPPHHPRWMMGEFGARRWAPDVDRYLAERVTDLERAGAGWAVFRWDSGWDVYERRENGFNVTANGENSALMRALRRGWSMNEARPRLALRR